MSATSGRSLNCARSTDLTLLREPVEKRCHVDSIEARDRSPSICDHHFVACLCLLQPGFELSTKLSYSDFSQCSAPVQFIAPEVYRSSRGWSMGMARDPAGSGLLVALTDRQDQLHHITRLKSPWRRVRTLQQLSAVAHGVCRNEKMGAFLKRTRSPSRCLPRSAPSADEMTDVGASTLIEGGSGSPGLTQGSLTVKSAVRMTVVEFVSSSKMISPSYFPAASWSRRDGSSVP